jgi:hypothetical protein
MPTDNPLGVIIDRNRRGKVMRHLWLGVFLFCSTCSDVLVPPAVLAQSHGGEASLRCSPRRPVVS